MDAAWQRIGELDELDDPQARSRVIRTAIRYGNVDIARAAMVAHIVSTVAIFGATLDDRA